MEMFPQLDELGLTGSLKHVSKFRKSEISTLCAEFGGTSLRIKDARFADDSCDVLFSLQSNKITSLCLERSELYIINDHTFVKGLFFPGLKKFKFVGASLTRTTLEILAELHLAKLFILQAKITHFEVSYGPHPEPHGNRVQDDKDSYLKAKIMHQYLRKELLQFLRDFCSDSLQVFIECNNIGDPFLGAEFDWRWWPSRGFVNFTQMKFLIFRYEDFKSLLARKSHECVLGSETQAVSRSNWDHSPQRYISALDAFFRYCPDVVVETKPYKTSLSWDSLAYRRLLSMANCAKNAIRYLIVGNSTDGYSGIECCPNSSCTDEMGNFMYDYYYLDGRLCDKVLLELQF